MYSSTVPPCSRMSPSSWVSLNRPRATTRGAVLFTARSRAMRRRSRCRARYRCRSVPGIPSALLRHRHGRLQPGAQVGVHDGAHVRIRHQTGVGGNIAQLIGDCRGRDRLESARVVGDQPGSKPCCQDGGRSCHEIACFLCHTRGPQRDYTDPGGKKFLLQRVPASDSGQVERHSALLLQHVFPALDNPCCSCQKRNPDQRPARTGSCPAAGSRGKSPGSG